MIDHHQYRAHQPDWCIVADPVTSTRLLLKAPVDSEQKCRVGHYQQT